MPASVVVFGVLVGPSLKVRCCIMSGQSGFAPPKIATGMPVKVIVKPVTVAAKPVPVTPTEEFFEASDGKQIFVRKYKLEEGKLKAVVHIHHGLGEHSARYDGFAQALLAEGFNVIVHDSRGHGRTSEAQDGVLGDVLCGPEGAVTRMVTDFAELLQSSHKTWPNVPILVFGHSFGTVVSRLCFCSVGLVAPPPVAALALSAAPSRIFPIAGVGFTALLGVLRVMKGSSGFSGIPTKLTFDKFQANLIKSGHHSGPVTGWDWLNRDPKEVQKYIDDEFCGFDASVGWWQSALAAILSLKDRSTNEKMPNDLRVAVFEGSHDFCTIDDDGIPAHVRLTEELQKGGKAPPKVVVYPGARHELLLELNSQEIIEDIIRFWKISLANKVEPQSKL